MAADCKSNINRLDRIHDLLQAAESKLSPPLEIEQLDPEDARLMLEAHNEYQDHFIRKILEGVAIPRSFYEPDQT